MTDEEEPPPRSGLPKPPLEALGEAELAAYVEELKAEIARAEAEMARKRLHKAAAEGLFRCG